jgi:hypothetical protein
MRRPIFNVCGWELPKVGSAVDQARAAFLHDYASILLLLALRNVTVKALSFNTTGQASASAGASVLLSNVIPSYCSWLLYDISVNFV